MKLKFAIVGCGRIVKKHAGALRAIKEAELVAVCDIVPQKAKAAGDSVNVPHYSNYDEMLSKHSDVDVVSVLTPSGLHARHVIDIVSKFKKHIVCEKPMALKLSEIGRAHV